MSTAVLWTGDPLVSTTYTAEAFTDDPTDFLGSQTELMERQGYRVVAGVLTQHEHPDGRTLTRVCLELEAT